MTAEVQKGDAVLIDVREAPELVADGMAEPAVWLATSEIKAKSERYQHILKALPKDKPIYVYCAVGRRSGPFAEALTALGYKATNFGALAAWKTEKGAMRALAEAKTQPCPYLCGPLK